MKKDKKEEAKGRKKLGFKLVIIFVTIMLVIASADIIIALRMFRMSIQAANRETMEEIAIINAKDIDDVVRGDTRILKMLSEIQIIKDGKISKSDGEYFEKLAADVGFMAFNYADTSGHVKRLNSEMTEFEIGDRAYFKEAMTGKIAISDAIVSRVTNSFVVILAAPVYKDGKIVAVVTGTKSLDYLNDACSNFDYRKSGQMYFLDKDFNLIGHTDRDMVSQQINVIEMGATDDNFRDVARFLKEIGDKKVGTGNYNMKGKDKIVGFSKLSNTDWYVVNSVDTADAYSDIGHTRILMFIVSLITLSIAFVLILLFSKSISDSFIVASRILKDKSNLDFVRKPEYEKPIAKMIKKNDERSEMAEAISVMNDRISEAIKNTEIATEEVKSSATRLNTIAAESAKASEEIANTITDVAQGATSQAHDVEDGSKNMDNMNQALIENNQLLEDLKSSTSKIVDAKNKGVETVQELSHATSESMRTSQEIAKVIKDTNESVNAIQASTDMIRSIAEQTNLLALNAAIEAARAGEQGNSFAVVADEIRKLAENSSSFTDEISAVVNELSKKASASVASVETMQNVVDIQSQKTGDTEAQFMEIANEIDNAQKVMVALNAAQSRINSQKDQMIEIMEHLSAIAEENAASTEEVSASVEELTAQMQEVSSASTTLSELSDNLEKIVRQFNLE